MEEAWNDYQDYTLVLPDPLSANDYPFSLAHRASSFTSRIPLLPGPHGPHASPPDHMTYIHDRSLRSTAALHS